MRHFYAIWANLTKWAWFFVGGILGGDKKLELRHTLFAGGFGIEVMVNKLVDKNFNMSTMQCYKKYQ